MIIRPERLKGIDIRVVDVVKKIAERAKAELGVDTLIVYGFRSFDEQNRLFAQGRTIPGDIVTNARAGQSPHNYHCAVDIVAQSIDPKTKKPFADWNNNRFYVIVKQECAKTTTVTHGWDWNRNGIADNEEGQRVFLDKPHIEVWGWRNIKANPKKLRPFTGEI